MGVHLRVRPSLWSSLLRFIFRGRLPEPAPSPSPPVRFILTVWKRSQLSDGWEERIGHFDAVSLKIVDRSSPHQISDAMQMAGRIAARGVRIHGWGFHHCTNEEETLEEVEEAIVRCEQVGVSGYHWNAERIWSEGSDPAKMGRLFARTFKERLPDVTLFANCFRSMVDPEMVSAMDFYEPMLYGTRVTTIARKFDREFSRDVAVPEKMAVMVGTGRMDGNREDRAWGYLDDEDVSPGLMSLVKTNRPRWVNFFRAGRIGNRGEDLLMDGNAINPSLPEQVSAIRGDMEGGIA